MFGWRYVNLFLLSYLVDCRWHFMNTVFFVSSLLSVKFSNAGWDEACSPMAWTASLRFWWHPLLIPRSPRTMESLLSHVVLRELRVLRAASGWFCHIDIAWFQGIFLLFCLASVLFWGSRIVFFVGICHMLEWRWEVHGSALLQLFPTNQVESTVLWSYELWEVK